MAMMADPDDVPVTGWDRGVDYDPRALDRAREMAQAPLAAALVSAREDLVGMRLMSAMGKELGHIDDVLIDIQQGRVLYAVIRFGGFMGLGSEYAPLPFGRLRFDAAQGGFMTDLTAEDFRTAPMAEMDWRSNREWQNRSNSHYGVDPYW